MAENTLVNGTYYKFQLSFRGQLIENSVDAFDVANTILATANALQEIGAIRYGEGAGDSIGININAFRHGSLITDFLVHVKDVAPAGVALIPYATNGYQIGKEMLSTLKTFMEVKQAFRGKAPKKVEPLSDGSFNLTGDNNVVINIQTPDFRALQSKTLAKDVARIVAPLTKDASELNSLQLKTDDDQLVEISKETAQYLEAEESFQILENVKYKGVVSKIDTKACSGYVDVGSKRLSFTFRRDISQDEFDVLVDSLRRKVEIYISGSVTMDYQSNPKSMVVSSVETDKKLFS